MATFHAKAKTRASFYVGAKAQRVEVVADSKGEVEVDDEYADIFDELFCVSPAHPFTSQPKEK